MIHHWMTDEKERLTDVATASSMFEPLQDDFYSALSKIKGIVSKPILTEEELDLLDSKAGAGLKSVGLVLFAAAFLLLLLNICCGYCLLCCCCCCFSAAIAHSAALCKLQFATQAFST